MSLFSDSCAKELVQSEKIRIDYSFLLYEICEINYVFNYNVTFEE